MKIPVTYLLPAAMLVGLGTYTAVTLSHASPAHVVTHQAAANQPRGDGLPPAPPASAPLTARERWIIEISAPLGHRRQILHEWEKAGKPPLYWSTWDHNYYYYLNRPGEPGNAMILYYTYIRRSPPWYGKPLKP